MDCPHCNRSVHPDWMAEILTDFASEGTENAFEIRYMICPSCERPIIEMRTGEASKGEASGGGFHCYGIRDEPSEVTLLWPKAPHLKSAHPSVPQQIAEDYEEAVMVFPYSPKASAALSRRCLQNILVDAAGAKKRDLVDQINETVAAHGFNLSLRRLLEAVRQVGNYAAHPTKDQVTGAIVDVEAGEADLNISTLESLMDFFYIRPAEEQEKLDAINKKLIAAGKKPIA